MYSSRSVDAPASDHGQFPDKTKDDQADSHHDVGEKLTRLPRIGDQ